MQQLNLFTLHTLPTTPRPMRMLDKYDTQTLFDAAMLMQDTGGSFASSIAKAYFVADSTNREKLLEAFSTLFESYIPRRLKSVE